MSNLKYRIGLIVALCVLAIWALFPRNVKVRQFGVPDHFIEHGAPDILKKLCGLTADDFATAARELVGEPAQLVALTS